MKVKLFWKNAPVGNGDKNARAFEDEINAWLSESPRIKIVDIRQSSSGGSFGSSLWFVSVWYGPRKGSQQLAGWLSEAIPPVRRIAVFRPRQGSQHRSH